MCQPLQPFLQPLQPVCNLFATFYFLCKSAEKPVVMRFLRYIFTFATFATYFWGLCGKIKKIKKSFLYIQGPSKIGCKGCKCKYARCKPAWCKGFRLVEVFFERLLFGCFQVAKVAILQPFDLSPFLCYTKQGSGDGLRNQLLTNYRICGIIKKIGKNNTYGVRHNR